MILETIKGSKNHHPQIRFRCECGTERTTRATKVRRGLVNQCVACAKATAAKRGAQKRRLPEAERLLRERWSIYKSNAKAKGLEVSLSLEEAKALFSQSCDYCGAEGGGIDRIDSAQGYVAGNVVACCATCNYAKRDMTRDRFLAWVERIHEHQSVLQRDRSILLRVAKQSDGRGANPTGDNLRQIARGPHARRCDVL